MFQPLVLLHLPTPPSINAVLPLHPSLHLSTTTRCEYQRRLPGLAHGFLSQPFHPQPCPCPHLRHINASVKVCLHQDPMRRTSELQRCLAGTINTKAGAKQHNLQRKLGIPSRETESTLPIQTGNSCLDFASFILSIPTVPWPPSAPVPFGFAFRNV